MTQEQLILFKELIKETVKTVVKEAIREELTSGSLKKDLKEVKMLLAKSIKEGREMRATLPETGEVASDFRTKLREAVGADFKLDSAKKTAPIPKMSEEQGLSMSMNGTLPDFDAPIPFIDKKSKIWEDLKNKV